MDYSFIIGAPVHNRVGSPEMGTLDYPKIFQVCLDWSKTPARHKASKESRASKTEALVTRLHLHKLHKVRIQHHYVLI